MAAKLPVKSILKQPAPTPSKSDVDAAKAERDRQHYEIALAHAHRIQHRKDWEAKILSAIQVLLEYPSATPFPANEATKFLTLIKPFQPGDLDALVEERVVDQRCGYALCSKQPRSIKLGRDAAWRLLGGDKGAGDFCSTACFRKTVYVKTQLREVPAWERDPTVPVDVQLPEEDRRSKDDIDPGAAAKGKAALVKVEDQAELALERGESASSLRPKQVVADRIVEKGQTRFKPMSGPSEVTVSHMAIEGYEPRGVMKIGRVEKDDSSDDDENVGGEGDDESDEEA